MDFPETDVKPVTLADKPQKTVYDWIRGMQMSAEVNKSTVGVETTKVTPDLLMATSRKLLGISRKEQDPDAKDSLLYQRFYGPAEYFSEHILRDSGQLGRGLLWKATNRGNVDFMPTAALDNHVSGVFYDSKLAQLADGSSPLDTIDAAYKTTRIGEGGIGDMRQAPDEMRLVQPSYFGYIDPTRAPESYRVGLDMYFSKNCMKGSDGKLYARFINAHTGKEELVDSATAAKSVVATSEMRNADTKSIFALGGKYGCRIVPKNKVDYYLPHADDAYSTASNMVSMLNGVKDLRLLMGCLYPDTPLLVCDKDRFASIIPAVGSGVAKYIPGADSAGFASMYPICNSIAKLSGRNMRFRKVVLKSGRSLITSPDHRWPVLVEGKIVLKQADQLVPGDVALRGNYNTLPVKQTFILGKRVTPEIAEFIGCIARSLTVPDVGKYRVCFMEEQQPAIENAIEKLGIKGCTFYRNRGELCLAIRDNAFIEWIDDNIGVDLETRKIPSVILSSRPAVAASFVQGYTANKSLVGIDSNEDIWILHLPNMPFRDALAVLLARCNTDTLYRDAVRKNNTHLALKLIPWKPNFGELKTDKVVMVQEIRKVPVMIDIDINDNMYLVGNGILTHNSKYPLQAVSLDNREAPLVRSLDEASGKTMQQLVSKYLGARYTQRGGTVSAVRRDRVDMIYDDGTKGSIDMYQNYPSNSKGFIHNTPVVKAGQHLDPGQLVASSNYTDKDGTSAIGVNLRSAWLSWKGGTYEDAIAISESAAKKLTSTTMYKTAVNLDKSIRLGKQLYNSWKPGTYSPEQQDNLDAQGIVKPGAILHKGDPMILAVQSTEPSPGTMGKRVLTDISETWEHAFPGVVTDVVQTKKGVQVFATVTAPAQVGDKLATGYGNKGVISQIIPDDQMPATADGKPLDVLFSPLGLITRTNSSVAYEALLGKIAKKTGKPYTMEAFHNGSLADFVKDELKRNHLKDSDDLVDPETGRKIPKVLNGVSYIYKLKHIADTKMSARGTDQYTSEGTPMSGGYTGGKRYGLLETSALVGHNALNVINDAHLIRGQNNTDFWRSIRTGEIPVVPGEPEVNKKFFAHLQASGVNVRKTPTEISVFALSNQDVNQLAGPREVKTRDTFETKNFRPIDGGLFGQDVFGINGDRWGYIKLDEPMPNPVMEDPLARLLNIPVKQFSAVAAGKAEINGMKSGADIKKALEKINLEAEARAAEKAFKDAPASKRDAALKRYTAIERMRRSGVSPADYMLDKIPVLPPMFRPVTTAGGMTMVADSNYLYAQMLDARDDMREAKNLPDEYQAEAREQLYNSWKELTGLYDPSDVKLRNKNVQGLLRWALGNSPKFSAVQRKVIGAAVDTVGRGVIVPDSRLKLNQVGIPEEMAFDIFAPFITRKLVQSNIPLQAAMKSVKDRTPMARSALLELMKNRPVQMNRAPTLHKLGIMGFSPTLVTGHAIHINPSIVAPFTADFDGDQVNIHVPVSDQAVRDTKERMFPERNLIAMSNRKILYKPEKEYTQGLYAATRFTGDPRTPKYVFNTLEEARAARRSGIIEISDPIEIKQLDTVRR